MPLTKGDNPEAIGHNISEMEKSGHPHEQAVAAALHTAKDSGETGVGTQAPTSMPGMGTMDYGYKDGDPVGCALDAPSSLPTSVSLEQMNAENRKFWTEPDKSIA